MRKILLLILFFAFISPSWGAGTLSTYQNNTSSQQTTSTNTVLNGIQANQAAIKNRLQSNINNGINKTTQTTATSNNSSSSQTTSSQPPTTNNVQQTNNKKHYIPHVYRYSYSNGNEGSNTTVNITNNTYIQNNNSESTSTNKAAAVTETQAQKDEKERQALRKKYASILSNKTASNEVVCNKMASYYTNVSDEELDRVLNKILLLNCDIAELRPGYTY